MTQKPQHFKVYVRRFKRYNNIKYFNCMTDALKNQQFSLYLQPQINIVTNEIVGAEVLVRWQHPKKGLLTPQYFIEQFEENGFITKLDLFVFEEACQLLHKWKQTGSKLIPLAVNVSRIDLQSPIFITQIFEILEKYKLEPSHINLEITETAYVNAHNKISIGMQLLHNKGFSIHLDDFGSGYAGLNMLHNTHIDTLKIDMSFVADCHTSSHSQNVLAGIVRMARWLKLKIIIEGVENKEQIDFLKALGCLVVQGYYYYKPLTITQFENLSNLPHEATINVNEGNDVDSFYQKIHMSDLWSPTSAFNLLFNSIPEAAAIYELSSNKLELLRANDRYFELNEISHQQHNFEINPKDYKLIEDEHTLLNRLPSDISHHSVKFFYYRTLPNGKAKYFQAKVKFLAGDSKRKLFFMLIKEHPLPSTNNHL